MYFHGRAIEKRRKYPLYRGGPERLEVRWTYGIKNMTVLMDNVELGQITGIKDAKKGKLFKLPDGSDLLVKIGLADDLLVNPNPLPIVEVQGKPLPGSTNDPQVIIERASKLFLIGGMATILQGILISSIADSGYGSWVLLIGVTAVVVSIYLRRWSRTALHIGYIIAIVSVIDFFEGIGIQKGSLESIWDFIEAVFFAWSLRSASFALTALEKEQVSKIKSAPTIEKTLSTQIEGKTETTKSPISKKVVRKTKTKTTKKTDTLKKSPVAVKKSTVKKGTKTAKRINTS